MKNWSQATITFLLMLTFSEIAWTFDWQVQGQGYSLSVIPGAAVSSLRWAQGGTAATLSFPLVTSLKVQYRSRDQGLVSHFLELQYQYYQWSAPAPPSVLQADTKHAFAAFAGQRSSSIRRFWVEYSAGASQELFMQTASPQFTRLETSWIYHARLSSSFAIWSSAFGKNPTNISVSPQDTPKLRVGLTLGALSPYNGNIISKYWGWESIAQLSYGNSLQWISVQYEIADQSSSQNRQRRESLRLEISMSLDRQKQREKGSGW